MSGAEQGRIDCYGLSHVGKVRQTNEDHFAIMTLHKSVRLLHTNLEDVGVMSRLTRPEAHVFVAADGVGGVAGGHAASDLTVRSVVEYVAEAVSCYHGSDAEEHAFVDQLTASVDRAHQRLKDTFGRGERGPATTLTMVTLLWPRAYVAHVGDSRGYYMRRGRLRQFTADQTIGDMAVDKGTVTEQQARKMGLYNILASAVGGEMVPAVGLLDLEPEDVLLLCTDGLTKHVPDDRIAHLLESAPSAEEACRALVDDALEQGGTDNVTVLVARMSVAGR